MEYFDYGQALEDYLVEATTPGQGVATGYSLDHDCGTMSRGELALLWARSGAGKSTLLLNFIANNPMVPTVFFNMEMRARTMAEWLTTMTVDVGLPYRVMKDVLVAGEKDPRYHEVMASLEAAFVEPPLVWMAEPQHPTVEDLREAITHIYADTGIRPVRVFIDHISLMYGARDYEGVLTTTAELHRWAQEDNILVVCAQQTGRSGNGQGRNDGHLPVTLSSGVFGGEADADWILGAWRPERDPKYRQPPTAFKSTAEYQSARMELSRLRGLTHLAVIKNRPYGTLAEDGVTLRWDNNTRRLLEVK